jgi:hypothetical protein
MRQGNTQPEGKEMTYTMPEPRVGHKWTSGYRPLKEIAADIRADIKAAKKTGDLPKDLKVSVRTDTYAGGGAIRVKLSGWDSERVYSPEGDGYFDMTEEAKNTMHQVEAIRRAYNRDASDSMVDYFDVTYYGTTDWDYSLRRP